LFWVAVQGKTSSVFLIFFPDTFLIFVVIQELKTKLT
jgi:hypothetical protein